MSHSDIKMNLKFGNIQLLKIQYRIKNRKCSWCTGFCYLRGFSYFQSDSYFMIATTDSPACSSFVYGHARIDEGQNIYWSWLLQSALNKVSYENIIIVLSSYSGFHRYGGDFARLVLRNSSNHKNRSLWKIETITDSIGRSARHLGLWQSTLPYKDMIKSRKKLKYTTVNHQLAVWRQHLSHSLV